MKTVITYGTFDMFHIGHLNLLKRLKGQGDYLIVAVSTDEFNKLKGKTCFFSYQERASIVSAIQYVDLVIAEHNWDQKKTDIQEYQVDVFGMGDDWKGKFDELKSCCEVVYLPRTKSISTTDLKRKLQWLNSERIKDIKSALDGVMDIVNAID